MKLRTNAGYLVEVSERYRKEITRTRRKYSQVEPVSISVQNGRVYLSCYGRVRYECPVKVQPRSMTP